MQDNSSPPWPVHAPLVTFDATLAKVAVPVERRTLAKRLWRGTAEDGVEFGFQLSAPLTPGDVVFATSAACYVIQQLPEPVLEIPLPSAPDDAAAFGWAVGNLHFPIETQPTRLLAPDDIALRQSLARTGIPFRPTEAVFRPHRYTAGANPHHQHAAPTGAEPPPTYKFIGRPPHG